MDGTTKILKCPDCNSSDYTKKGLTAIGSQRYKCRNCGRKFTAFTASNYIEKKSGEEHTRPPRVFIFDVENAPSKAAIWQMWKQDIHSDQVTEEWYMLTWAGKWLFDTEIYSDALSPDDAKAGNDKRIMESLWQFIDYADILIGHNIAKFDVLKMNTRFAVNGIIPPSTCQYIDTLIAAKKNFSFTRNNLDYLCRQFGVARKADNGGIKRWIGCTEGDPQDLKDMEEYNKQDIVASEELYLAMRPFMKSHPNIALYQDNESDACYKCGSTNLEWLYDEAGRARHYYTNVNKYPTYRCRDCQSIGRSRFSAMTTLERKHITSPIAR